MLNFSKAEIDAIKDALSFEYDTGVWDYPEYVAMHNDSLERLIVMMESHDLNFCNNDIDNLCHTLRIYINNSHDISLNHLYLSRKLHTYKLSNYGVLAHETK